MKTHIRDVDARHDHKQVVIVRVNIARIDQYSIHKNRRSNIKKYRNTYIYRYFFRI